MFNVTAIVSGPGPVLVRLLPIVDQLLLEAANLKRAEKDFSPRMDGPLSIAATHSQARYALPHVVHDFREKFPQVTLHLPQGSLKQIAELLISGWRTANP